MAGRATAVERRGLMNIDLLPSAVADVLREEIIAGALPAGERLVETSLADQLAVSRGPVREALKQLVEEGLVVNAPRRGAHVIDLDEDDIREVYDVRAAIETRAIRLLMAGPNGTAASESMVRILRRLEAAARRGDAKGARDLDLVFHEQLYIFCGNRRLHAAFLRLVPVIRLVNRSRHELFHSLSEVPPEHQPIIASIGAGDRARAEREIEEHLEHAKNLLIAHLAEVRADAAATPAAPVAAVSRIEEVARGES